MPDFTVHRYGTDTSGRGIFLTAYMHNWWRGVVADLGFEPVIVQGAFMVRNGGGAAASAGYHDAGGCIDLRTWNLTRSQIDKTIRTIRLHGAAAWRRDARHGGMDPHIHLTLGTDSPLTPGARASWHSYLDGRDGLASNGPDYEWRPSPLVTTPPKEDDMPAPRDWTDKDWEAFERHAGRGVWARKLGRDKQPASLLQLWAGNGANRVQAAVNRLHAQVDALPEGATKAQVKALLNDLDATIQLVVNDTEE